MNLREFLEQHDRAKQLLLEGERSPWLDRHVAACEVCGPLAGRLAEIDRMIEDVPEPRAELLRSILRSRQRDDLRAAAGRIEVLWPSVPASEAPQRAGTLAPLVISVEADRYPPETPLPRHVERFVVVARHPAIVGRAPDVDVPLWDRSASRRHAELAWRGDGWVLRDLESTNGTRVNGARVASQVTALRPGDQIEIGKHARLTVRTLLPALDPLAIGRHVRHLLGWAAAPAATPRGQELRALREETVQLRDELSSIAIRGADAESLPMVYERLTNMLALIEEELLA